LENLKKHIPESSWVLLEELLKSYSGDIAITRPRKTKLGDFRANSSTNQIRISVNSDLNHYSFLITLLHELAHYFTWKKHKRTVLPHGVEWKHEFRMLLIPFIKAGVFPERLEKALQRHFKSPKASSCTDPFLYKALDVYSKSDDLTFISDLPLGTIFEFQSKGTFKIKERLRKRIKCVHHQSGKSYLFQPITKVKAVQH